MMSMMNLDKTIQLFWQGKGEISRFFSDVFYGWSIRWFLNDFQLDENASSLCRRFYIAHSLNLQSRIKYEKELWNQFYISIRTLWIVIIFKEVLNSIFKITIFSFIKFVPHKFSNKSILKGMFKLINTFIAH